MDNRYFNAIMPFLNSTWAARVSNMQVNSHRGPDLISEDKVMELKFKVIYPNEYMHISWRVLEYQMNYDKNEKSLPAYWGLGTYTLKKHVSDIELRSLKELEILVLDRTLTIVNWDWMNQFQPHRQTGQTKKSKWDNTIRFPKGKLLPKTIAAYNTRDGKVNITEGVSLEEFNIKGKLTFLNP